ncbi:MAG: proline dehydrogenase [Chloroflexota bacterium]|nr:proline dehydrogenase [Chloroflexota bacterium]
MRVELLATVDCPHLERAEEVARQALANNGHTPAIDRVYVSDLDTAAGLGFHGSPTLRIDGRDVVPPPAGEPVHLGCRLYRQPDGSLDGVIPAPTIVAAVERREEEAAAIEAARLHPRAIPAKLSKAFFLWASHRRFLGWLATAFPLTRRMVRRFVPGERLDDAMATLEGLQAQGMRWTVDVLGESVASEAMATAAADRYIETLDALQARGLEANVSVKLTQMGLDIDRDFCVANVRRIVERARVAGAFVRIDMEDHTKTSKTLEIVRELRGSYPEVGAVIQSYLRRSAADVAALNSDGIRVRLCKGAYDEPASIAFRTRDEVDRSYIELMERLLTEGTYPGLATHDDRLVDHALEFAKAHDIDTSRYEFQMLYGIRRDLQERLVALDQTVRVYVPYGSQWYPYYMRRLAERPQNVISILVSVLNEGRGAKKPELHG